MNLREKSTLCSPDIDGYLDYATSIINFKKYDGRHKKLLKKSIQPKVDSNTINFDLIEATKLITHELTHYLDLTTTVWGVEFLVRRDLALSKISETAQEAVNVSMLNISEILMHKELVKIHRLVRLENIKLAHTVTYDKKYGPIIIIHISKHGDLIAETPLSMLSLLEANAVANEMMAEAKWISTTCGSLSNYHEQRISSRLDEIIKDPNRLEYNILHLLIKLHFPELNFLSKLSLSVAIFDFALNISGIDMSAMANLLVRTITNRETGDALCNDLCRGMSRQVVSFKLILLIHQYINETGLGNQEMTDLLEKDPLSIIISTLKHFGLELPSHKGNTLSFSDLEYNAGIRLLRKHKGKFEPKGHISSMLKNRRIRRTSCFIAHNLKKYELPDLLLDDETRFKMPTRQRYNVTQHWDEMYEECLAFNKLANSPDVNKKFHLGLGEWGPMQELRSRTIAARILRDINNTE